MKCAWGGIIASRGRLYVKSTKKECSTRCLVGWHDFEIEQNLSFCKFSRIKFSRITMEVGSQTEPMDRQDILNLLRQKSFELEKKTGVSCGDQDEIHSVEIIDGESPHFNSHNEDTTGAGLRKNSQAVGKQLSSKKSLKAGHPLEQPSLADMICDAVWSRKGSFHSPGPSRSSSKKSRLVRSQSFSKGYFRIIFSQSTSLTCASTQLNLTHWLPMSINVFKLLTFKILFKSP